MLLAIPLSGIIWGIYLWKSSNFHLNAIPRLVISIFAFILLYIVMMNEPWKPGILLIVIFALAFIAAEVALPVAFRGNMLQRLITIPLIFFPFIELFKTTAYTASILSHHPH